jgi:hypothetical protein
MAAYDVISLIIERHFVRELLTKTTLEGQLTTAVAGGGRGVVFSAVCLGCCALGIKAETVIKYLKSDRIK